MQSSEILSILFVYPRMLAKNHCKLWRS